MQANFYTHLHVWMQKMKQNAFPFSSGSVKVSSEGSSES